MKITIAPSKDQSYENYPRNAVTIEAPIDDVELPDALEIIYSALVAWGYDPEGVHNAMNNFTR